MAKRFESEKNNLDKKLHCKYNVMKEIHFEWEDRFLMLGLSNKLNLLLICHCYREATGNIRIISARESAILTMPTKPPLSQKIN